MEIEEEGVIYEAIKAHRLANPLSRARRLFVWAGERREAKWKQCVLCSWRSAAFSVFATNLDSILEECAQHRAKHIVQLSEGGESK